MQRGGRLVWTARNLLVDRRFCSQLTCVDVAARVPEEHAAASGIAPDQVKIKKEYGGGYPANVEGLHHLHCLVGAA
jgi:hypothetical protein